VVRQQLASPELLSQSAALQKTTSHTPSQIKSRPEATELLAYKKSPPTGSGG
jgi:hypothetical protein